MNGLGIGLGLEESSFKLNYLFTLSFFVIQSNYFFYRLWFGMMTLVSTSCSKYFYTLLLLSYWLKSYECIGSVEVLVLYKAFEVQYANIRCNTKCRCGNSSVSKLLDLSNGNRKWQQRKYELELRFCSIWCRMIYERYIGRIWGWLGR